ncbi:hypothetical protein BDP27DRAFT_1422506 [Rhodocollybia butyracea]|uniref:Uncharacterized protein n=1 Tax=Rhodocollybia butyracea TaxID=206335 RepID=A0A9P5U6A3_9AGAR|nr:hypothetical protein BDP27DRAFT_1422506 [Rhodocollybia butyracea]
METHRAVASLTELPFFGEEHIPTGSPFQPLSTHCSSHHVPTQVLSLNYNSDSNSSFTYTMPSSTSNSDWAELLIPSNPASAPSRFSAGKIMPKKFHKWEQQVKSHFQTKVVPAAEQVGRLLNCFDHPQIVNWIEVNNNLVTLTYNDFLHKLCNVVLEKHWKDSHYRKLQSPHHALTW